MIQISIEKKLQGATGEMNLSVDIEIQEGSFVALSGASGSGKTTLLRVLAGLETAEGRISVNGEEWLSQTKSLPPQKRSIGFVFQEYALFENMTVEQNLLFVAKDKALAEKLLNITAMSALKDRYPSSLSGGQKQRVSLARAMMRRPKILLLDEPLSALDPSMRAKLQEEILSLHKEFGTTTLMVSHDPSEIYKLAERVLVLENARIKEDGSVKEVLLQTQGSQKLSFFGEILDIIKADVINIAVVAIGQQIVEVVLCQEEAKAFCIGQKVQISTKAFAPTLKAL